MPPPDQRPGWEARVRKYGKGVTDVVQFVSELSDGVTPRQKAGLIRHDFIAQHEAYETGYLAHYEAGEYMLDGEPNDLGIADSSCLWTDEAAAAAATHRPFHAASVNYMIQENIYKDFLIRKYKTEADRELGLRLTLVRTLTKAQIERHIKGRNI